MKDEEEEVLEAFRRLKETAMDALAEQPPDGAMSRRDALKYLAIAGAGLAFGAAGCERKPKRQIVSAASAPDYRRPGKALYYASTWTEGPYPYGLLVKTVDGRPVKVEGNPEHPVNRGASSAAMQAALQTLYDPDRLRGPRVRGAPSSWGEADRLAVAALRGAASRDRDADSVVIITRATLGPSERALLCLFTWSCRSARHFIHETVHDGPRRAAWKKIYGRDGEALPRLDRARVVLSLDSDFLGSDGAVLENIRHFAERRAIDGPASNKSPRFYAVESTPTVTGANADHRLRLKPSAMLDLALALRAEINGGGGGSQFRDFIRAAAADLKAAAGETPSTALVVAGPHLPESVHAAVALINRDLSAPDNTLEWNDSPPALPVSDRAEAETVLEKGVDVLIMAGVNPVYDWPGFAPFMKKAKLTIGHGLRLDETLSECDMALPSSHNLESWNDAAPRDGIVSLCQPVIRPLFDSRQEADSFLAWARELAFDGGPVRDIKDWHEFISRSWKGRIIPLGDGDPERAAKSMWEKGLRAGGGFDAKAPPFPMLNIGAAEALANKRPRSGEYEVVILPHPSVHDGRFANSGWLQEMPDPLSTLVWDNAAAISPTTAEKLGAAEGDLLEISVNGKSIAIPALVQPGAADGVAAVTLGHGLRAAGRICGGVGVNAAPLLGAEDLAAPRVAFSAVIKKAGGHAELVRVQRETSMHGRPIVLEGTAAEYRADPSLIKHKRPKAGQADIYPPRDYSNGHKWVMAVDLNACVGCGACAVACEAENNSPIVGKDECANGRRMAWLRIDIYRDGGPDEQRVSFQPMLCQQCDDAPCENVCPVNATTHSEEGLNQMVYNRCVGTRYCSNNCPYKVRRFNFFDWQKRQIVDPVQELMFNPQVTVRSVGVMEKCTFCVQRIQEAKLRAKDRLASLADGEVRTACQQACPARAIHFGDANDPRADVAKSLASPRAFHVLEELNVKPNVTYLARMRNPRRAGGGEP
jgi:Fe-S-cluster-containing dehydrogenase component/anaerobic selenocysteine-containing dehydrogenase